MATRKISPKLPRDARDGGRKDKAELEKLDDEALARLVKERENQPTIRFSVKDLSGPDDAGEVEGIKTQEMRG